MPRTKILASALALALGGTSAVQAQSFSDVIVFGDSLSDAGNVAQLQGLPAGNSFTTNPDPVYAEIVAAWFGDTLTRSLAGGTDYAYGGACARPNGATFTCALSPGSFSLPTQIGTHLAANGGQADPNALYMMWGGANDIFTAAGNPATAQLNTGIAAGTMVNLIANVQNAGARTIVVFNLPDLGLTPDNVGTAAQAGASGLTFAYNSTFNNGLANLGDGIVPINVFGLINEIVGAPSLYGFSNVTGKACGTGSSVACGPVGSGLPFSYANGTNNSYLFADSVHPTGAAHRILANVVIATLSAPGQVSMAGEIPLQVYDNASNTINHQIFGMSGGQRSEDEANVYAAAHFTNQDFNASANTNAFDNNLFTGVFGADVRYSDAISFGAAITFGGSNGDAFGASLDTKEVLLSGYGVAHFGRGYIDAIITGGSSNIDIDRSIEMGATTRVERGGTSATHIAGELGAGFNFGGENISHGPFASLTWQEVEVGDYAEDGLSSTAMYFGEFTRTSQVTRLGYQLQGRSGGFRPYARVAWANDSENEVAAVQAGSNTMNGHFTLDGFIPAEDWMEADVGIDWALSERTTLGAAYRGRFSDDTQDVSSFNVHVHWAFRGAPEPVAEVVVAPQQTCADLDDDGDGVNNCDDKCPTTPTGEAIGADGCPVPAEPEPVMDAKPFRG